ncbi:isopentenyl-diphosphate Delta-isomerase [Sphingobacterium sp. DK4209]|uniref:Isopentenyl-diphosphate delta-isomerase n=1 Tax=Sphingobacterium zhuxiongii TaxID=2662364 RepID=A0A5Q0QHG6_9SPHI|nr:MULTISPECIES: isopentenyl-diphosphate Delta-isomerase [unclassified Sphingobacterium]MVZ67069.1 isopentenyl-diphosphate Delta-isomerase [Sphingobacterium sp. DK4209]QGA26860.1 isopentenyl-diphosphate Delta-isomerase [Sphingobacterium sp. dk4302]
MPTEYVILVDEQDKPLGEMEKQEAHLQNRKHRAFSVFLQDADGKIILQKRAAVKYHSPNLWTNACCGHPRPNESTIDAAKRRTYEELGIEVDIREIFTLSYEEKLANGLWENEFDHVFLGSYTQPITNFNLDEVSDIRSESIESIAKDVQTNPEEYTFWFQKILPKLISYL